MTDLEIAAALRRAYRDGFEKAKELIIKKLSATTYADNGKSFSEEIIKSLQPEGEK